MAMGQMQGCPSQRHEDRPSQRHEDRPSQRHEDRPSQRHEDRPSQRHEDREWRRAVLISSSFWLVARMGLCYNGALVTQTLPTTK
jgi:hypothetical protein